LASLSVSSPIGGAATDRLTRRVGV
jgi:hypothetical protein